MSTKAFKDHCGLLALQLIKSAVSHDVLSENTNQQKIGILVLDIAERLLFLSLSEKDIQDSEETKRNSRITAYEMLACVRHKQFDFMEKTKPIPGYDLSVPKFVRYE